MTDGTRGAHIGRRVRELRVWHGWSMQVIADRAGITQGYLSKIERGLAPVDKRSTLEALAAALHAAPNDLTGTPLQIRAGEAGPEHAALPSLRTALGEFDPYDNDTDPPPWAQVASRVARVSYLRPRAEYAELGAMLPDLLRDLYASVDGPHSHDALKGLAQCYLSSLSACKNLGASDLAHVAALRIRDVAHRLSGPEWAGLAAYARAQAIGSGARERAGTLAVKAANDISPHLDQTPVAEVYGMLHLMAALANTTQGKLDVAQDHIDEAEAIAQRPGVGELNWMTMWFGKGNVGYWQTMLAVERGDGGKAVEIGKGIDPATKPKAPSREAMFLIDLGRGWAMEGRKYYDAALDAWLRAEGLAPQITRSSAWVREGATAMLASAQRNAGGSKLRGLVYRMGVAS
jgi:transcriptional regulator with XRE-family HTH domain